LAARISEKEVVFLILERELSNKFKVLYGLSRNVSFRWK